MAKLDSQNRLLIPTSLIKSTNTNLQEEIRLYLCGQYFYLDNPSFENAKIPNLGQITLDSQHRLFVKAHMQEALGIDKNTNLTCFLLNEKITFKRVLFIPENR